MVLAKTRPTKVASNAAQANPSEAFGATAMTTSTLLVLLLRPTGEMGASLALIQIDPPVLTRIDPLKIRSAQAGVRRTGGCSGEGCKLVIARGRRAWSASP